MSPRLKICGVTRAVDLDACVDLGVDAIGLNLWPGSRRYLSRPKAAALLGQDRAAELSTVGVFVDQELAEVERAIASLELDLIQHHGDQPGEPYAELAAHYEIGWIWVIRGVRDLSRLRVPQPAPRWILLDAAVEGYGGSGRRTDWGWAKEAVSALAPHPVWLAGGIRPDNVGEALRTVLPAGIDVASGAEPAGAKAGEKSREAIAALVAGCRRACSDPPGPRSSGA